MTLEKNEVNFFQFTLFFVVLWSKMKARTFCTLLVLSEVFLLSVLDSFTRFTLAFFSRVMTLHMSPMDDTFVSGSLDRTLRLWDLRSPNCQVN